MPVIRQSDAGLHACPWNEFKPCLGEKCMAWARHGRGQEFRDTDNIIETPDGLRPSDMAPPTPDGEGWERDGPEFSKGYHLSGKLGLPKARAQRWLRKLHLTDGHCARAGHGDCGGHW